MDNINVPGTEYPQLTPKEYIETRLESQKKYFSKNSARCKRGFVRWSVIELVCSLLIIVISPLCGNAEIGPVTIYENIKIAALPVFPVLAVLAAIVAMSEGITLIKKYMGKKGYLRWSVIKLICSLMITVLAPLSGDTKIGPITIYEDIKIGAVPVFCIVAILGAIVALSEGIVLSGKHYENWMIYRSTNERLKREEMLYKTRSGVYNRGKNDAETYNMFVVNIEDILEDSNRSWKSTNTNTNQSRNQTPAPKNVPTKNAT